MRNIPEAAVDLVAKWEGCELRAYLCPAGVWTIGYGHTGAQARKGNTVTEYEARQLLATDLQTAGEKIVRCTSNVLVGQLTECQWAALLSFAFNCGFQQSWGIAKRLNAREFRLVPAELRKWIYAKGKVLPGLRNRREEEVELWNKP